MADRNALMAGYQSRGGVLDTLDLPHVQPAQSPSLMQYLTDYAGRGLGVVDHWAMGIPSTMSGLVNSAIPGQPLGDLWSAKSAAEDARSAVAQSGGADLLALPDAFLGSLGNVPAYAKPAAQLAPPAARQAGRIAESAIDPVYNAMPSNAVGSAGGKLTPPPGITAFHGSPHDFDRFDMSKIGTGEGAQAYGHGLYFAENEGVAKQYRDDIGRKQAIVSGRGDDLRQTVRDLSIDDVRAMRSAEGDKTRSANLDLVISDMQNGTKFSDIAKDWPGPAFRYTFGEDIYKPPGRMYEVRINADPGDFLDWDKPLSAQSEKVRNAFYDAYPDLTDAQKASVEKELGGTIYKGIGAKLKETSKAPDPFATDNTLGGLLSSMDRADLAAQHLRDKGVAGARYLDQGSRTAGEGSRNYVVFRDDIISVVKKYGIAAAISAYGMDQVQQVMGESEPPNPLMQGY